MSIFNINAFKKVVKGVQRSSLFTVSFSFPSGVTTDINGIDKLSLVCSAASIPQASVQKIDVNYMGRQIHFPGGRADEGEWEVTIILDNDWAVYKTLYEWHNLLNGPVTNVASDEVMEHLKATAVISTYASDSSSNGEWTLYGCYPTELPQLNLDWKEDTALNLQARFVYDYCYPTSLNNRKTTDIIKS